MKTVKSMLRGLSFSKLFRRQNEAGSTTSVAESGSDVSVSDLEEMVEFYSQFFSTDDLVFDVGANMGNRSQAFLEIGAKVVAFEPQPGCIDQLNQQFATHDRFELVPCVLGSSEGKVDLMICDASTISSLSSDWINAVKTSGRFSGFSWDKKLSVQMKTLEQMIAAYGSPKFIKIDVEGSEFSVLSGLSAPVNSGSIEFVPEFIESSLKCIRHLDGLGDYGFNYCIGEDLQLILDTNASGKEMESILTEFVKADPNNFGDVYFCLN